MNVTIKGAYIGAVAVIVAAILTSIPIYFSEDESSQGNTVEISGSKNTPVIQDSQGVTINYSEKSDQEEDVPRPEDRLEQIFIDANEQFIESIFGVPVVTNEVNNGKVKESIYSFDKFYLQLVYDEGKSLIFYSVTSKDINFHPRIPSLGSQLGQATFAEISEGAEYLYSYLSSKHYGYGEYVYAGNAGNYFNYFLAYNSSGVYYGPLDMPVTYVESQGNEKLDEFRASMRPNSFGVGGMGQIVVEDLNIEIGPEFYTFRHEAPK